MSSFMKKVGLAGFALSLMLMTPGARNVISGGVNGVAAQDTSDQVKIDTYKRFVDNRISNPTIAYQAARDYMQKYPKDKDQYTDYLKQWMTFYERDDRKNRLPILINEKNFV